MKAFLLCSLCLLLGGIKAFTEDERQAEYHARNHTWPIPSFRPNTEGWDKLMRHRLRQVEEIEDSKERFEGYAQTLSAGLIQPNYTEHGFAIVRAPEELTETLRTAIRDGVAAGPREEYYIPVIEGLRPWFIDRPDLTQRVLNELQHYPETWTGIELTPEVAYGFRLYRNESRLHMHVDRPKTHVISFIYHIDSSDDAEPWPILIEDFQGNTHEVVLAPGDMVFYESSKVFHGRPHTFKGTWYSSIFVHYYPKYEYKENFESTEMVYSIPPRWENQPESHFEIPLKMHGTGFEEPDCPDGWCGTQNTIKWTGPAENGKLTLPTGDILPFDPKAIQCIDKNTQCAEWASRVSVDGVEECKRNFKYMFQYCPRSCGVCTESSSFSAQEL